VQANFLELKRAPAPKPRAASAGGDGSDSLLTTGLEAKTILFSGHDLRFLKPFLAHCERSPRYRLCLDEHPGHEITDVEKSRELVKKADYIFCEWCLGNAVWYSHHKLPGQRLVIRLHLQEMNLSYLERVQWKNVDALILICPLNCDLIRQRFPFLKDKTFTIYNPIDSFALDQPKLPGAEFNLGIMGISPMRKAPHLAFEILARLKQIDRRYTLFVKGNHPRQYDWLWRRPEERAYFKRLFDDISRSAYADSVIFETYGNDVPLWFSKVGFILSTSDFEGSHQSVAEGMASGAIPIIRNWAGADALYPSKYVFRTVDDAVRHVLKFNGVATYEEETRFCRTFAREQFEQVEICKQLENLLIGAPPASGSSTVVLTETRRTPPALPRVMVLGYLPPGATGGYRIRIEQEIRTLASLHCEVHLACLYPQESKPADVDRHRRELETLGATLHLVPVNRFFDVKLDPNVVGGTLDTLEHIIRTQEPQVLHAEALYCARLGILLKQRCPGLRVAFDCHGATPAEERMSGAHVSRVAAMEDWERRVLREADLNIFVSGSMEDFFVTQYGAFATPRCTVPCCVSDERFPSENAPSPLPSLPANRPVVAYVGTLAAWQCAEEMIRLFAQLRHHDPQTFLLLLAPRNDHQKAHSLLSRHQIPPRDVLVAELPHSQVAAALQRAHGGMLLRRDHPVNQVSSPTKFGEYLAAGLPVIMTDRIGDFSSLAASSGIGIVLEPAVLDADHFPSDDLRRIVDFLRTSMSRRQEIATRCRRTARDLLHWEAAGADLIQAYRGLLPETPNHFSDRKPA
jgi:glycosyltransferase involved in cell wall biosynthesis